MLDRRRQLERVRLAGTPWRPAALVLLCLLLWLPGVIGIPASDRDESRFVQGTKQMLETGDFVSIRNGEEARNRKPIGIYWLQAPFAAAARAAGVATLNPVWPYRIPSVLGGLLAVMATYGLWRRTLGREPAFLAAVMLGASVIVAVEAGIAKTDATLLGVTTLAMGLLARAYLDPGGLSAMQAGVFWLAIGVGVLVKGPVTPMVAGLAVVSLVAVDWRTRSASWLRTLRPRWGVPLLLAVVLPWFIAIGITTGGKFFVDSIGGDLGAKLASGDDSHGGPPGLHLLLLPLLFFPFSIPVIRSLPGTWRERRDPVMRFLLAWIVPAWIVFELVPTKLPHYTLPLYPALALLAARWMLDRGRRAPPRWAAALSTFAFVASAAVLGLGLAALPFVAAPGLSTLDLLGLPALAGVAIGAWLILRATARHDWRAMARAGVIAAPLLYWPSLGFELPELTPLWISSRVEAALAAHWPDGRPADAAFGAAGFREPSLMFLAGTDTKWLYGGSGAARFLAAAPDRVAAVGNRDLAQFHVEASKLGITPHAFAEIAGFNYSRGRRVTLTLFDLPD
jgi:4-amino-4-deoxy-L-arabinose transferase-like glycosyltransferase